MNTSTGRHFANATMKMSPAGRARLREGEKVVLRYYDDMGTTRGNCTWGAGILAHRGICSEEELTRKVSLQDVNLEFDRKVAEAEGYVKRRVSKVALTQEQFDALVSLTYNLGPSGTKDTYVLVNKGEFEAAARNISKLTRVWVRRRGRRVAVVAPGLIKRRAAESAPFRTKSSEETAQ